MGLGQGPGILHTGGGNCRWTVAPLQHSPSHRPAVHLYWSRLLSSGFASVAGSSVGFLLVFSVVVGLVRLSECRVWVRLWLAPGARLTALRGGPSRVVRPAWNLGFSLWRFRGFGWCLCWGLVRLVCDGRDGAVLRAVAVAASAGVGAKAW